MGFLTSCTGLQPLAGQPATGGKPMQTSTATLGCAETAETSDSTPRCTTTPGAPAANLPIARIGLGRHRHQPCPPTSCLAFQAPPRFARKMQCICPLDIPGFVQASCQGIPGLPQTKTLVSLSSQAARPRQATWQRPDLGAAAGLPCPRGEKSWFLWIRASPIQPFHLAIVHRWMVVCLRPCS